MMLRLMCGGIEPSPLLSYELSSPRAILCTCHLLVHVLPECAAISVPVARLAPPQAACRMRGCSGADGISHYQLMVSHICFASDSSSVPHHVVIIILILTAEVPHALHLLLPWQPSTCALAHPWLIKPLCVHRVQQGSLITHRQRAIAAGIMGRVLYRHML